MKAIVFLLLGFLSVAAAQLSCDDGEIACRNEERCVLVRYICDSDDDCNDESDEAPELCDVWKNDQCSRNEVQCLRNGDVSCIEIAEYCTSDPPCEGALDKRLCVMLEKGKLDPLETFALVAASQGNLNISGQLAERFRDLIPNTLRHEDCPPMYTLVADQCLSIFHIGSMSWGESREFCKIIGGDLVTFRNVSQYSAVVQHLHRYDLTANFWVGASIENADKGWRFTDGSPVELGTPFWATRYSQSCVQRNVTLPQSEQACYRYYQAPEAEPKGQCLSLSFEHFFYMADDDCVKKMSPLCAYTGDDKFNKKNNFFL